MVIEIFLTNVRTKRFQKVNHTAQKMKFSIKDFFSKCDQIRRKLPVWSHLLKKSLMGNFIFCAVLITHEIMTGDTEFLNIKLM